MKCVFEVFGVMCVWFYVNLCVWSCGSICDYARLRGCDYEWFGWRGGGFVGECWYLVVG